MAKFHLEKYVDRFYMNAVRKNHKFNLKNKLIILLFIAFVIGFRIFSLAKTPMGTAQDITNNQLQVMIIPLKR
ncbi:hypothetical protein BTO04_12810 [Polaribacter sp. SA4-10]|uniref:hypothetical protein n=1 Tax=Polaribacter sp. SA4-10 TaxID=754397 RepID=UPI000B3C996B|nr:hypothetical protein [Polaribacter sp. SA4-10]ARV07516.1 hypothetical protein BTO04_12810 [Polaribacter sp. SA4-10]